MEYHEFLGEVQNRARLANLEEAVAATRSTLQSLAERLEDGEVDHLKAQLPREIAYYVDQIKTTERFGVQEFFERVSERENQGLLTAAHHARAVVDVLSDAVPQEMEDLRDGLPDEWQQLFEAGSEGELDIET